MAILITVLDLEREPLEFSETVPPGAIDYGSGIRQLDGMPVSGRADLLTEQTQQQLEISALSIANQANQSVLKLFS